MSRKNGYLVKTGGLALGILSLVGAYSCGSNAKPVQSATETAVERDNLSQPIATPPMPMKQTPEPLRTPVPEDPKPKPTP